MTPQSRLIEGEFAVRDLFREASALALTDSSVSNNRQTIESGKFRGWMWMEEVHPGLSGSACDMVTLSDAVMAQRVERSIGITVLLRGGSGTLLSGDDEPIVCEPERAQIIGFGEERQHTRILKSGEHCVRTGLMIRQRFLDHHSDALTTEHADLLNAWLAPGMRTLALDRCVDLVRLANGLVDAPYCGSLGRLFRESATAQMMFQSLRLLHAGDRQVRQIGRRHYDAILHAQALLDAALLAPPGTIELARQVGLNRNALQAGFKTMFGTTVFGYVREQRLNMARVLIEEHRLGAAEAGYKVGFASPPAFSSAYKRRFGHPPIAGARARRRGI
jgi:AraC-like DNA-binding protein